MESYQKWGTPKKDYIFNPNNASAPLFSMSFAWIATFWQIKERQLYFSYETLQRK
jgi:hypothetical protein